MFLEPTEAWQLLSLCTALVVAFLLAAHFTKLKAKVPLFYSWIGAIAIFGGVLAFLLPIALNSGFGKDDDGRVLRQLILYTTGGVLGVITLGESHRKNNQEKEKNENDHTRQVYAERRSRYTKAIEQLADEKAAVRLGGIYTLVGLVDEWLADDTLNPKERQKEGQVIVNNLCSYIRSPFPLALKAEMFEGDSEPDNYEGDFSKDQAAFHEEQDVRHTIFVEMSKRSSDVILDDDGKLIEIIPGTWSDFDVDFSRAPIFYPLKNLTIEQGNFASTRFYGKADFWGAKFIRNADFRNAKFTRDADFWSAEFAGNADFGDAYLGNVKFVGDADFGNAKFTRNADFQYAKFVGDADFGNAKFTRNAYFQYAKFTRNADFWEAEFTGDTDFWEAEFIGNAHFLGAKFIGNAHFLGAKFTENADFGNTKFTGNAGFGNAKFTRNAHFLGAKFTGNADFGNTKFTGDAYFLDAKFTGNANFGNAKFTGYVGFNGSYFGQYAPTFAGISGAARFSAQVDPQDYVFTVREGSKAIKRGTATLLGKSFIIPLGTVLFGPSSRGKNSRTSEPAKPLDESNNRKDDAPE